MLENLKIFLFKDKFGNHISKYKSFLLSSVFQPIFNHNNNIVGVEALLRIKDVSGESICPGFYFSDQNPDKEDKVTIDKISRILHLNNFASSQYCNKKLFLNLLPDAIKTLHSPCLYDIRFLREMKKLNISSKQVVLELLEVGCDNLYELQRSIGNLNNYGFNIAIDDFGSEHSNANRVSLICSSVLKIDKSLLNQFMKGNKTNLTQAMKMANIFKAQTVIEGIENQNQLDTMRALNIDMYQGYFLAMPQPIASCPE
ncbi:MULTISPECIES: EAL domain-containing protein [Vibrio]|uniref:EAL domain-containing protein n=1 Tax=Vibrio TaxID=662 RepID=UPI000B5D026D|nr:MULTISPECIES: EAL domain-containing protein [Vibrio]HBV77382.1 EAL domain-containing protein [Vibrio sp.]